MKSSLTPWDKISPPLMGPSTCCSNHWRLCGAVVPESNWCCEHMRWCSMKRW